MYVISTRWSRVEFPEYRIKAVSNYTHLVMSLALLKSLLLSNPCQHDIVQAGRPHPFLNRNNQVHKCYKIFWIGSGVIRNSYMANAFYWDLPRCNLMFASLTSALCNCETWSYPSTNTCMLRCCITTSTVCLRTSKIRGLPALPTPCERPVPGCVLCCLHHLSNLWKLPKFIIIKTVKCIFHFWNSLGSFFK